MESVVGGLVPCSGEHGQCPVGELAPLRAEWSVGDLNWPAFGSASQSPTNRVTAVY